MTGDAREAMANLVYSFAAESLNKSLLRSLNNVFPWLAVVALTYLGRSSRRSASYEVWQRLTMGLLRR